MSALLPESSSPVAVTGLQASWHALDHDVRVHLETFMTGRTDAERRGEIEVTMYGQLPSTFNDDVVTDRARLRQAFPILHRSLTAVRLVPRPSIYFSCEAVHDGLWFDFMQPTHRAIRYVERHWLQRRPDGALVDVVRIDFASIIRQLTRTV